VTTPSAAPGRAEPGAAAGLSFDHIQMTFPDGTEAVADATFRVERGEFVTVVGPSGCGKSTLLRIASGLLDATGGSISTAVPERASGTQRAGGRKRPAWPGNAMIGYVFQDPTLMPWRTVRGNVELLPELHGLPREERRRLGQQAIDLVGLTDFEHHYPKSLSGGMRMRCSLARTLTLQPPIMLFDEPFGAVDEITRERLNEETLRLFEDQRFAGLFITHSISEAVFMSSRVLVMSPRPGRIIAEIDVPFAYPRDPDLRFEPRFAAISAEVSHTLRAGGQ
jgi:NitT/TauT family transport system ATP-binding protein